MMLKPRTLLSCFAILALAAVLTAGPAFGQAARGRSVIHIGGSFNKALADGAKAGFFGVGFFAGKMMNNNLCLGVASGYDVVHYHTYTPFSSIGTGGPDFTETIAVVPAALKAKYYFSLGPMIQIYPQVGGGIYNVAARLGDNEVGGISRNLTRPGGSIGIGLDYWFLLTTGVGFEFEYQTIRLPGDRGWFSYWSLRVDYGIIKF